MGTTCEIAAQMPNGRWKQIHISYDGYVTGVGLTLFRDYGTPEKVAALLAHRTGAVQLCTDPGEMSWDDWHPDEGFTLDELVAQHRHDTSHMSEQDRAYYAQFEDEVGFLGLYAYAHGRWAAPRSTDALVSFVETGEGPDVLTRELLIEEGADESEFSVDKKPLRPVNLHRGVLSVKPITGENGEGGFEMKLTEPGRDVPDAANLHRGHENAEPPVDAEAADPLGDMIAEMEEEDRGGTVWNLAPDPRFEGVFGLEGEGEIDMLSLDGRTVEILAGNVMVSSSFGPEGSESTSAMTVRRITMVDDGPAQPDQKAARA